VACSDEPCARTPNLQPIPQTQCMRAVRCKSMTLKEACSVPKHTSAMCVQSFDDSLNSAIHTTYRISLRSSSLREPRYPLSKVLVDYWRDSFLSRCSVKGGVIMISDRCVSHGQHVTTRSRESPRKLHGITRIGLRVVIVFGEIYRPR
jgi:hypothetical protein